MSFKCNEITSLIVINPFGVLVTCTYPSPSIKPTKKAINDEGIERYSFLSSLILRPFFNANGLTVPIVGKLKAVNTNVEYSVMFFDSTISLPIQGTALTKLVIQF